MSFERANGHGARSSSGVHPTAGRVPGKRTLTESLPESPIIQRRAADAAPDATARTGSADEAFSEATTSGGREVPHRAQMERAFGQDFSNVRAHVGQSGPMHQISARAATRGQDVAFATDSPDAHLVAHELAHVVQNRVRGDQAVATKSGLSHPADASEREADAIADQVASGGIVTGELGGRGGCDKCGGAETGAGNVKRAAEPGAAEPGAAEPAAATHAAKRQQDAARMTSLVGSGITYIRKISSPQVAAQREAQLHAQVAILDHHKGAPQVAHGGAEAEQRASHHVDMLEQHHGRLASAASGASREPVTDDGAGPAGTPKVASATKPDAARAAAPQPATSRVQRQVIQRSPECDDLLQQIIDLINELKQRFDELRNDPQHLQWDNWSTTNPKPGVGSVEGHQIQFTQKQTRLRRFLDRFNTDNCGGGGPALPADAWQWATREAPVPIPQSRPAPTTSSSSSSSSSGVWAAIAVGCAIGIGLLLAPEITGPALLFAL